MSKDWSKFLEEEDEVPRKKNKERGKGKKLKKMKRQKDGEWD